MPARSRFPFQLVLLAVAVPLAGTPSARADPCSDDDGDGWYACDGAPGPWDCDDDDPAVNPGAPELCDGIDDDCDGALADDELDGDGDGWAACEGDCDDDDDAVHPDADEICEDGVDSDCDGVDPACDDPPEGPGLGDGEPGWGDDAASGDDYGPDEALEPDPPSGCDCDQSAAGWTARGGVLGLVVILLLALLGRRQDR